MLDVKAIREIIPHRYPFLLIDRIEGIEPGIKAKGFKNLTINEEFFQGHFPQEPVMPGVLQVEALAQVGACVILSKEEFKGKTAYFAGINKIRFKRKVVPGDRLDLEVEITKIKGSIGIGKGVASVDGEKACEGEILFAIG